MATNVAYFGLIVFVCVLINFYYFRSSRPSYGDDAISYVQLKQEGNICTVKCKICPEHKVHAKLYAVTLIVDVDEEKIISIECHDCVAAQGGCKHAMALLMWVHRRSEEPSCTKLNVTGGNVNYRELALP